MTKLLHSDNEPISLRIPDFQFPISMCVHAGTDIHISRGIRAEGIWEPNETHLITHMLQPGQTFIDVGANIGYFSLVASKLVGPNGRVFAFEPDRNNFELLAQNCIHNQCNNVDCVNAALSVDNTEGTLYLNEDNMGDHIIYPSHETRNSTGITLLNGSDFVAKKGDSVHFLKVDTQGSEYHVIKGLESTIRSNMPEMVMLIEFSPISLKTAGASGRALLDLLHGFNGFFYILDSRVGCLFSISYEHLGKWIALTEMDKNSEGFINLIVSGKPLNNINGLSLTNNPQCFENGLEQLLASQFSPWDGQCCNTNNMMKFLYFASGWSFLEDWGVWSNGNQSRILFSLDKSICSEGENAQLTVQGRYYGASEETKVYLGEHFLGDYTLTNCTIKFDRSLLEDRTLTLKLVHKKPLIPSEQGDSQDNRALKFGLEQIALTIT